MTTDDGRDLLPAALVWSVLIVGALAADVALARTGKGLLTDVARTVPGWTFRTVLELHFQKALGRFDPFASVGVPARRARP